MNTMIFPDEVIAAGNPAARPDPDERPEREDVFINGGAFADLDAAVVREMARLGIPGMAVAVVAGGRIAHARGFGHARPGGEPPTPRTPFFIGSVTKSFTALAVMQLVEAGAIELDAPARRYLPWFRVDDAAATAQITVRHLLNQTSGLPNWAGEVILADFDADPGAAERQARALAAIKPARLPGAAFEYSNSNYQLLGLIIEAAGGERYETYVRRHIFDPLGMRRTTTSPAEARENGLAVGHRLWFGRPVAAPDLPLPRGAMAGGLIISTAEDLGRYALALLNGGCLDDARLLSSGGVAEMTRGAVAFGAAGLGPALAFVVRRLDLGQYAMGWSVGSMGGERVVYHGGTLPDFGAFVGLLPDRRIGLVLLGNACNHWMNPVYAELGNALLARLAGVRPGPTPFLRLIPGLLRALPVVPALQIADVAATLRPPRRAGAEHPAANGREWARRLVVPTLFHAWLALSLRGLIGKESGYRRLYQPDTYWLSAIGGLFSLVWAVPRAVLVIRALRRKQSREGASAGKRGLGRRRD